MRKYTVGALLLSSAIAAPALAADLGTNAGATITNNFTVNYSVGGTPQTPRTTTGAERAQFVVDRKVNLVVTEKGGDTTSFSPGDTNRVTTFTVTNKTNDWMDYRLVASNEAAGDNGDMGNLRVFVESGATPGYQPGEDTATFIDELAEDASVDVYILADDNGSLTTSGETSNVRLLAVSALAATGPTATVRSTGALGADLVKNNADANTAAVQNVFVDVVNGAANDTTIAEDGRASSRDTYVFSTATLTLAKTSAVIWDPVNAATNPKLIPGAVVEYCLAVTNNGTSAANSVSFSDVIPANATDATGLTSTPGGVSWITGANTASPGAAFNVQYFAIGGATCAALGTPEDEDATGSSTSTTGTGDAGSFNSSTGTVSASIASIPASATRVVRFRVTIR